MASAASPLAMLHMKLQYFLQCILNSALRAAPGPEGVRALPGRGEVTFFVLEMAKLWVGLKKLSAQREAEVAMYFSKVTESARACSSYSD